MIKSSIAEKINLIKTKYPIIGLVEFSREEIVYIKSEVKIIYKSLKDDGHFNSKKFIGREKIKNIEGYFLISIINSCKEKFNCDEPDDDCFWTIVFQDIFEESIYIDNCFYDILESEFKYLNKKLFISNKKRSFRVSVLAQSLMPKKTAIDFCSFLYEDCFCNEDILNYSFEDKSTINNIFNFLYKKFSSEELSEKDSDSFYSSSKIYSFKQSIKKIVLNDENASKFIIKYLLDKIDKASRTENSSENLNELNYLDIIISEVVTSSEEEVTKLREKRKNRKLILSSFEEFFPEYFLYINSEEFCLNINIPNIKTDKDSKDQIIFKLYDNDCEIKTLKGQIIETEYGLNKIRNEELNIDIEELHSFNLRLDILINNSVVFSSEKKLFRDILFFLNTENKEYVKEYNSKKLKPNDYYVLSFNELENFSCSEFYEYTDTVKSGSFQNGDFVEINNIKYYFLDSDKVFVEFDSKKAFKNECVEKILFYRENKEYEVFKDLLNLKIFGLNDLNNISFYINGNKIDFSNIEDNYICINFKNLNKDNSYHFSIMRLDKVIFDKYFYLTNNLYIENINREYLSNKKTTMKYTLGSKSFEEEFLNNIKYFDISLNTKEYFRVHLFYFLYKFDIFEEFEFNKFDKKIFFESNIFHNNFNLIIDTNIKGPYLEISGNKIYPDKNIFKFEKELNMENIFSYITIYFYINSNRYTLCTISKKRELYNIYFDLFKDFCDIKDYCGNEKDRFVIKKDGKSFIKINSDGSIDLKYLLSVNYDSYFDKSIFEIFAIDFWNNEYKLDSYKSKDFFKKHSIYNKFFKNKNLIILKDSKEIGNLFNIEFDYCEIDSDSKIELTFKGLLNFYENKKSPTCFIIKINYNEDFEDFILNKTINIIPGPNLPEINISHNPRIDTEYTFEII